MPARAAVGPLSPAEQALAARLRRGEVSAVSEATRLGSSALEPLIAQLLSRTEVGRRGPSLIVQYYATVAPGPLPRELFYLIDEDRELALLALSGDPRLLGPLRRLVALRSRQEDWPARRSALTALLELGDRAAGVELLRDWPEQMFRDEDEQGLLALNGLVSAAIHQRRLGTPFPEGRRTLRQHVAVLSRWSGVRMVLDPALEGELLDTVIPWTVRTDRLKLVLRWLGRRGAHFVLRPGSFLVTTWTGAVAHWRKRLLKGDPPAR